MKAFVYVLIFPFLIVGCLPSYGELLAADESSSPALQLEKMQITFGKVDHISVALRKDSPRYHYLVHDSSTIRWILKGIRNLRQNKMKIKGNGEIAIYLKDGRVFSMPFVFNPQSPRRFTNFVYIYEADEDFCAVLELIYQRVSGTSQLSSAPGPWSDKIHAEAPVSTAEHFDRMGRSALALEVMGKILPYDKKELQSKVNIMAPTFKSDLDDPRNAAKGWMAGHYCLMIRNLRKLGRYDEAVKWCGLLMELFADDESRSHLGVPYNKLITSFALYQLADIYKDKEEYEKALNSYKKIQSIYEETQNYWRDDEELKEYWNSSLNIVNKGISECKAKIANSRR